MIDPDDLPVLDGYAAWAPFYDDDGNPLTEIEGPALQSWFGPLHGRRVLDLGCGTGRHTLALAQAGATVTALDGSAEMLALARQKLQGYSVDWLQSELPSPLPFPDSGFDLVVLGLIAEHIEDLGSVLKEAARVTKSGGQCLLSALHPDRTASGQRARFIDPASGQRRQLVTIHRTAADYLAIAAAAGWSLVEARSLLVTPEVATRLPRAMPYVGLPLGWAGWWRKT